MINIEKIGCNLCAFRFDNGDAVILEYDYKYKGFRECSDYLMTCHYYYNGRQYDRRKYRNITRYYMLLSSIDIDTWNNAYLLF